MKLWEYKGRPFIRPLVPSEKPKGILETIHGRYEGFIKEYPLVAKKNFHKPYCILSVNAIGVFMQDKGSSFVIL